MYRCDLVALSNRFLYIFWLIFLTISTLDSLDESYMQVQIMIDQIQIHTCCDSPCYVYTIKTSKERKRENEILVCFLPLFTILVNFFVYFQKCVSLFT